MKIQPSRHSLGARRAAAFSTPHRQRGAAAIFGGVAIVAAVIALLLGINIGNLYFAQRNLQKLAVIGAMAGVQISSGCRNSGIPYTNTAQGDTLWNKVQQAITSNNGNSTGAATGVMTGIGSDAAVEVGWVNTSSGQSITDGGTVYTAPADGLRHFIALPSGDTNTNINAVRVNLTQTAPSLLGGSLFPGPPNLLRASATAMQQPLGAFSIGSTLANLNTANSVLNPLLSGLLGASVNLSAVDYQDLAQTQISLADLMVAANVTDLADLLTVNDNVAGLQTLLAAATKTVNPSVANLITGLTLGSTQAGTTVPLAGLLGNVGTALNPTVTDAAAQVPFVDVLDMLTAIGEAAAAKNGITINLPVSVQVPGLLNTYAFLTVLQPPQLSGLGPVGTSQNTAQIRLQLRANVNPSGVLSLLPVADLLAQATVNLGVDVTVAAASGTISTLVCPSSGGTPSANVAVTTGLTTLQLGGFFGNPQSDPSITATNAPLLNVTLLGIPIVTLGVITPPSTTLGSGSGTAGPFTDYAAPQLVPDTTHNYDYLACNDTVENPCAAPDSSNPQTPVSSANIAAGITTLVGNLSAKNNLKVDVLGIGLGSLLDPIISALNTALLTPVTNLVDSLLNPLLAALGVQVGSGTLLWQEFETGEPVIVTTAIPGTTGS